jgi:hypothetical protein
MPSGIYKRTPEMKTGKYERTPEHNVANSKARTDVPLSPEHCAAIKEAKTGIPQSPEHIAAVKKGIENSDAVKAYHDAQIGIPLSPEHIAAIREGMLNSDAVKAQIESMRGGNDLVNHHYIYDESDLSLNTVQMTRSDHMSLHMLLKKLGYIVPHINKEE